MMALKVAVCFYSAVFTYKICSVAYWMMAPAGAGRGLSVGKRHVQMCREIAYSWPFLPS